MVKLMYVAMHTAAGPAKKARPVNKARNHNHFSHYLNQLNTERNPSPVHCDLIPRQHAVQIGWVCTLVATYIKFLKYTSSVFTLADLLNKFIIATLKTLLVSWYYS